MLRSCPFLCSGVCGVSNAALDITVGGGGGSGGHSGIFLDDQDLACPYVTDFECPADVGTLKAETLTRDEVAVLQETAIEETCELLNVPRDDALLLLRHFKWSQESLSESFFADPEAARSAAGVSGLPPQGPGRPPAPAGQPCGICFAEAPISVLPCGHSSYCQSCWEQYITTAVQDGKGCLDLRCPSAKCGERVRPSDVKRFCQRKDLQTSYDRFLLESYVADNPELAWCPGRGCSRACRVPASSIAVHVDCACGAHWCLKCREDAHLPVRCEVVSAWSTKNKDTRADATWIMANTKPCPKCKNPIEKNGGCMHMTCRKPGGCGHEFCWICMAPWKGHTQCNKYSEDTASVAAMDEARSDLLRYTHHFARFREHERAQDYASTTQRRQASSLHSDLMEVQGVRLKDLEWLDSAVNEIVSCRRFLKWTYAYGYVIGATLSVKRLQLFEFHQAQLEETLEKLSHCMEITLASWRDYVQTTASPVKDFSKTRGEVLSLMSVLQSSFSTLSVELGSEDMSAPADKAAMDLP